MPLYKIEYEGGSEELVNIPNSVTLQMYLRTIGVKVLKVWLLMEEYTRTRGNPTS